MICYACNENYPNAPVELFWICPNCKKPEETGHKILTSGKSFYEIEPPKRTKELVLVARWIPAQKENTGLCSAMVGNGLCQLSTTWQCFICNQWTCDLHESKTKGYDRRAICEGCAQLTPEEQEAILKLWRELSQ